MGAGGLPFFCLAALNDGHVITCGDHVVMPLPPGAWAVPFEVERLLREDEHGRLASEFLAGLVAGVALAAFEGVCHIARDAAPLRTVPRERPVVGG